MLLYYEEDGICATVKVRVQLSLPIRLSISYYSRGSQGEHLCQF